MHFIRFWIHLSYTFLHQSLSNFLSAFKVACFSSPKFSSLIPLNSALTWGNAAKSIDAKSRLYGRCMIWLKPKSPISSRFIIAVCAGALSWWKMTFSICFANAGHFFQIRSLLSTRKLVRNCVKTFCAKKKRCSCEPFLYQNVNFK